MLFPSGPARDTSLPVCGELGLDAAEVDTTGHGVALDVPVILAAAGYRIAHTTTGVCFPSHVGALESQVRSASADLLGECGGQITPVYPQVAPGFAAFVASPTWFAEAKLVVAFLDARAVRGHAFAVVLSFPTTVKEINRVAGFSSVAAHDIFVSGQPLPLDEHLEVALPTGSLIRMLPPGSKPLWAAPLAFALWHPHYWPSGVILPRTRESACALVLHSSGKYLYDRFSSDDWANQNGIASLVGVPLAEVRMQAANPAEMLPYVYRGAPVRGVIAVVERSPGRDSQGRQLPYVVFLDSRPLGFDFNFVVCEQLSLSVDWLLQYLQQPPPAGWRLAVKGGQRQQDRVDFFPGEVLILGFQRLAEEAEEQPESEAGFSSDPEQDDDSGSGDGHRSDSSTRSRSRDHTSEPRTKSEDRSYQGLCTPPDASTHSAPLCCEELPLAELGPLSSVVAAASAGALQVQVSAAKCCLRLLQSLEPCVPHAKCRVPDYSGQALLDFAEPLDVLQQSLRDWAAHPGAPPSACGLAEDACLLLDPELWCDDFRRGKRGVQGFVACAELQSPSDCKLNFVLTGVSAVFKVDDPPLPEFVYPFRHSVPLATARRHLDWLEQACDTFSTFLSTSQLSPVFLEASPRALSCLEPVTGWALGAGLARRPGGLGSPI